MMTAMKRNRSDDCLSDLILDRRLLGELSAEESTAAALHLATCTACAERLRALDAGRAAFLEVAPPFAALTGGEVRAPAGTRPSLRLIQGGAAGGIAAGAGAAGAARTGAASRGAGADAPGEGRSAERAFARGGGHTLALATAMIAALAASIATFTVLLPRETTGPATRTKGPAQPEPPARLGVYIKSGERVRKGETGEQVHPGDILRFSYSMDRSRHVAILSLDGARRASVYFPFGTVAAPLPAADEGTFPDGIELDGALGPERIYGLFCEDAIAVEPLRRALEERGAPPDPPAGCVVDRLELEKVARTEGPARR